MKSVWIIEMFDAEPYENYKDGVHSVWSSEELANSFYNENCGVLEEDLDNFDYGYFLREPYEMVVDMVVDGF